MYKAVICKLKSKVKCFAGKDKQPEENRLNLSD